MNKNSYQICFLLTHFQIAFFKIKNIKVPLYTVKEVHPFVDCVHRGRVL